LEDLIPKVIENDSFVFAYENFLSPDKNKKFSLFQRPDASASKVVGISLPISSPDGSRLVEKDDALSKSESG
jgi:hypothetical protein